jgi:hypothetical protein
MVERVLGIVRMRSNESPEDTSKAAVPERVIVGILMPVMIVVTLGMVIAIGHRVSLVVHSSNRNVVIHSAPPWALQRHAR